MYWGSPQSRALIRVADIRLHQSFILPANADAGRPSPIRVTYADAGYRRSIDDVDEQDREEPVILFIAGMMGSRYLSYTAEHMAHKHKVRVLMMDRPGFGGTPLVPLEKRMDTWLGMYLLERGVVSDGLTAVDLCAD